MKLAVMLPNWIGDVVMATPALRALRKHFGSKASITGIMRPYVAKVLEGTNWLDEIIYFDRKLRHSELRVPSLLRHLRRRQFDSMLLMPNSFRAAAIAWAGGVRERVGYVRYGRGPLLTRRLYPPRRDGKLAPVSAVDYYLDLTYCIGCDPEPRRLELATTEQDEAGADLVWENLSLANSEQVIVFNTGSAQSSARCWPTEYYVELARRIVCDSRNSVLVICGPSEREVAHTVEQTVDHPRVRSMAHQNLDLGVAKACIRRSSVMVTTDSGPRHIATALDIPVVAMFGPIDPRWTETYHRESINLLHRVPCGPCGQRACFLEHHSCMRDLSVEQVYTAVLKILEKRRSVIAC